MTPSANQPVLDVLRKARELISEPERWCVGALARKPSGYHVGPAGTTACQWCAEGAVIRFAGKKWGPRYSAAIDALQATMRAPAATDWHELYDFNDTHTHAEVLALFDRTIARLEAATDRARLAPESH